MHFVYIDDSNDDNAQSRRLCSFASLIIPDVQWLESFMMVKDFRRWLKNKYGLYINKELHACEFVAGRGHISNQTITKYERSVIFVETLKLTSRLPNAKILVAAGKKSNQYLLFERLLNRINKNMESNSSKAVLFCDEGNNRVYTQLRRRMGIFNQIPSRYGVWRDTGSSTKNIPIRNILEDPVFKDSKQSYFIQLVDFASYALLRQENQIASRNKYNIHIAFDQLNNLLVPEAFKGDKRGIIRDI